MSAYLMISLNTQAFLALNSLELADSEVPQKTINIVKNGKIHNGKQNYKCRDCGRQFVENRQQ